MNSIQLSRGLLNFTMLQTMRDWVLPYWAEQQYNPKSMSFIPRSHMGLSINVTNRNWTAIGNPYCTTEPIVDPRGLLTPFRNGWSIDVWIGVDGTTFFPSRSDSAEQKLVDDLPVVCTTFTLSDIELVLTSYTQGNQLFHQVRINNTSREERQMPSRTRFRMCATAIRSKAGSIIITAPATACPIKPAKRRSLATRWTDSASTASTIATGANSPTTISMSATAAPVKWSGTASSDRSITTC